MKGEGVEKAVVVPLCQAGITGLLSACAVFTACLLWRWPWAWAGLAGCVVTCGSWLYFRGEVRTRLDVESGVVQVRPVEPAQLEPARAFQLEVDYNEGAAGDFLQLGVTPEKFAAWCEGVNAGCSLAQAGWIGRGGVFSRSEYERLISELLKAGYIRLRNSNGHAQGYELTAKGRALARGATLAHAHARTHSMRETTPAAGRLN